MNNLAFKRQHLKKIKYKNNCRTIQEFIEWFYKSINELEINKFRSVLERFQDIRYSYADLTQVEDDGKDGMFLSPFIDWYKLVYGTYMFNNDTPTLHILKYDMREWAVNKKYIWKEIPTLYQEKYDKIIKDKLKMFIDPKREYTVFGWELDDEDGNIALFPTNITDVVDDGIVDKFVIEVIDDIMQM